MSAGGKGHSPRPFDVAFEQYAANFDQIFRKSNVLQQETQNSDRNPQAASPEEVRSQVLGDRQSPAECLSSPQDE